MSPRFAISLLIISTCVVDPTYAEPSSSRYTIVSRDGTTLSAQQIAGWDKFPSELQIDDKSIDPSELRLIIRSAAATDLRDSSPIVEMWQGDRLPGQVKSAVPPDDAGASAHLVVETSQARITPAPDGPRQVRVYTKAIRRIVWIPPGRSKWEPSTLLFADGREVSYRGLRWRDGGITVLTSEGPLQVAFDQLAELRLPARDSWESYFEELRQLAPDGQKTLVRMSTQDDLVVTGAEASIASAIYVEPVPGSERHTMAAALQRRIEQMEQNLKQQEVQLQKELVREVERQQKDEEKAANDLRKGKVDATALQQEYDRRRRELDQRSRDEVDKARRRLERDRVKLEADLRQAKATDARRRVDSLVRQRTAEIKRIADSYKRQVDQLTRQKLQAIQRSVDQGRRNRQIADRARQLRDRAKRGPERFKQQILRMKTTIQELRMAQARMVPASIASTDPARVWVHALHPVWSPDPIWVPFRNLLIRQSFSPEEVPLSRIVASSIEQKSLIGQGWVVRSDRNVMGRLLRSGHRIYGWGIGVHAMNQLTFELPGEAVAFQTHVGLDHEVGNGGCSRVLVFEGTSEEEKPLYRSPLLIGSQQVEHSGRLELSKVKDDQPRNLVLVADTAHEDRPPGKDPWDIRDQVNWLEPMILLDTAKLPERLKR